MHPTIKWTIIIGLVVRLFLHDYGLSFKIFINDPKQALESYKSASLMISLSATAPTSGANRSAVNSAASDTNTSAPSTISAIHMTRSLNSTDNIILGPTTKTPDIKIPSERSATASIDPPSIESILTPSEAKAQMMQCRTDLQDWLQPQIREWVHKNMPFLDWVSILPDGMIRINFVLGHLQSSYNSSWTTRAKELPRYKFYCGTNSYNEPATMHFVRKSSQLFMMCNRTNILKHSNSSAEALMVWSPDLGPEIFNLEPMLKCDALEQTVGKPKEPIKVAMCSVIYGDDWTAMAPAFSEYYTYHRMLGVKHFWVFVNTETSPAHPLPDIDDVTFIPYNYRWKHYTNTILAYDGVSVWQEAMQNQCLSRLRRYGVDWVTTIDVDEFLDVRREDSRSANNSLTHYLEEFERKQMAESKSVAAIRMANVPFSWSDNRPFRMLMDFTFRLDNSTGWTDRKRSKLIYNTQFCDTAGVHWCRKEVNGGRVLGVEPITDLMLHHLKYGVRTAVKSPNPPTGYWPGQGNHQLPVQDSYMSDTYRTAVCHDMINGPFAPNLKHLDEEKCNDWPTGKILEDHDSKSSK